MTDPSIPAAPPRCKCAVRAILLEALLVAAVGVVLALVANQVSPRGLKLARNYFPAGTVRPPLLAAIPTPTNAVAANANAIESNQAQQLVEQMKQLGLQVIGHGQAVQFFHDAGYRTNRILFVDARDQDRYREGHIPGAYEFDPYRPEKYAATVLPLCQRAETVVVYCNGGDCDDSQAAAMTLRDDGIDNQKIFVYAGGMTEWTNTMPVEVGGRNGTGGAHPK